MKKNKENWADELGLSTSKFRPSDTEVDNNVDFLKKATQGGIMRKNLIEKVHQSRPQASKQFLRLRGRALTFVFQVYIVLITLCVHPKRRCPESKVTNVVFEDERNAKHETPEYVMVLDCFNLRSI